jgi:hypothetical protein
MSISANVLSPSSPSRSSEGLASRRPAVRAPARQHTRGLIGALNAEWRWLAEDPSAGCQVGDWGRVMPALAGLDGPDAVVRAATRSGDDDALEALLVLAGEGDHLAARTALQVMLGAAVRLARRTCAYAGNDLEESIARAVAATWQVIRDYPLDRRACRPADGISLDVLAVLTGGGRPAVTELPAGLPAEVGDQVDHEPDGTGPREAFWAAVRLHVGRACADEELIVVLAWGVRMGVISQSDARLLLQLHSPADPGHGVSCREVAEQLGLAHAAVRQRASRATRRLASAVQSVLKAGDGSVDSAECGVEPIAA